MRPISTSSTPAARLVRALGSVKFTLLLLAASALALAWGTLVERSRGAGAARSLVYGSTWFQVTLFLIAVNLTAAVIKRLPLRRSQIPFLVTHAAIVLLLAGAWISHAFGVEGRMAIAEKERSDRIYLEDFQLLARWKKAASGIEAPGGAGGTTWTFPFPRDSSLEGVPLLEEGPDRPSLWVVRYLPDGVPRAELAPGGDADPPAVEFLIAGRRIHGFQWVLANHPVFRRKNLGPVEVEILLARDPAFFRERKKALDRAPRIVEIFPGGGAPPVLLPLPEKLGVPVPLGGGREARVLKYFSRARVGPEGLEDDPSAPVNPAVLVEIRKGGLVETHTAFSLFPEFGVVRGRKGKGLVEKVRLQASGVGSVPLVSILVGPGNDLFVQLSASVGRGEAFPCPPGKRIVLGNLGLDFMVKRFLPHARARMDVRPALPGEEGSPWLVAGASFQGKSGEARLGPGGSETIPLGDRDLVLRFGRRSLGLPFQVELLDFELHTYPGTNRPADYRSRVRILPGEGGGPPLERVISMNRPLSYEGYRFFQSSYRLGGPGRPDVTILTVSRDPGTPVVYAAFVLLLLGVGWYLVPGRGRAGRKDSEGNGP